MASAYAFVLDDCLAALAGLPVCVAVGEQSHPAVTRANALIAGGIPGATLETFAGAAHFMIATHPAQTTTPVMQQIARAG